MNRLDRRINSSSPPDLLKALGVLICIVLPLAGCYREERVGSDMAVAKMSEADVQATSFLPLNADKPGESIDATPYFVRGKYSIVEYYSPFDDSSVALEPRLMQLVQVRNDLAVRTINVNRPEAQGIDWQSPVVQEMRLQTLPHFMIYDPNGQLRAQGRPAMEQVKQWVQ